MTSLKTVWLSSLRLRDVRSTGSRASRAFTSVRSLSRYRFDLKLHRRLKYLQSKRGKTFIFDFVQTLLCASPTGFFFFFSGSSQCQRNAKGNMFFSFCLLACLSSPSSPPPYEVQLFFRKFTTYEKPKKCQIPRYLRKMSVQKEKKKGFRNSFLAFLPIVCLKFVETTNIHKAESQ